MCARNNNALANKINIVNLNKISQSTVWVGKFSLTVLGFTKIQNLIHWYWATELAFITLQ